MEVSSNCNADLTLRSRLAVLQHDLPGGLQARKKILAAKTIQSASKHNLRIQGSDKAVHARGRNNLAGKGARYPSIRQEKHPVGAITAVHLGAVCSPILCNRDHWPSDDSRIYRPRSNSAPCSPPSLVLDGHFRDAAARSHSKSGQPV